MGGTDFLHLNADHQIEVDGYCYQIKALDKSGIYP